MSASKDEKISTPKPAGRVRHDSSGRAIWEWAAESGRHALDSTSALLKRLDLPGLALADDEKKKQKREKKAREAAGQEADTSPSIPTFGGPVEEDPAGRTRRSFNPYDTRIPKRLDPRPAAKPTARTTQPLAKRKRSFFARIFGRK